MTFYGVARGLLVALFKVVFRVRVTGKERVPRKGAYVLAPSHRSILDIPFAAFVTRRRIRFMAKQELFGSRLGRRLFTALGAITVARGTTDRAALRASQAALEGGEPIGIFPEGTRRSGPVLGDLYDGAAYLALKLGLPIVPVGIGGSEEILASGRILPRIHKVVVVVGEPVVPMTGDGARRRSAVHILSEELRTNLQSCFDAARVAAGTSAAVARDGGERE